METELRNRKFIYFVLQATVIQGLIVCLIIGVNCSVDASQVITPYVETARLALEGNIVAVPENYNERLYQVAIVDGMEESPETVIIGSSRGMFLGEAVTGYSDLYNNCVSGACMEDYYALLGLYYKKFSRLPARVIIETSPWIFYGDNPEARWTEEYVYTSSAAYFYYTVNRVKLNKEVERENPYVSLSYFRYNLSVLKEKGIRAFQKEPARISIDPTEAADYPDGSIRYAADLENASEERLAAVRAASGAVTYENVNKMTGIDSDKAEEYENLLRFLLENRVEICIFMSPFSNTQCQYIYDEKKNIIFDDVENYLKEFGSKYPMKVVGGYDAREFGLTDEYYIDSVHLDRTGNQILWNLCTN